MSVAYRGVDPDPDPNEEAWEAAEQRVDALESALGKSKCTAEMDGGDDPEHISMYISFHGLTLENFNQDLSERIHDLYQANMKQGA